MAKKILFIEDEQTTQTIISQMLNERGYEVTIASDGQEGIDLAQKAKPDLILLDIILPKRDGFEVMEFLKQDKELKDIPVVLLTNLSQPADIQRALELGATTYLVKSDYELEDIIKKVEQAIELDS